MSSKLASLDFSSEVSRLTKGFTGRVWLFATLAELINAQTQQLILLTGEPGIGKSSLAARLLSVRKDVVAYHFCFARRVETITPSTVIRSLATQLSESLPAFNMALLQSIKPWQVVLNVNIQIRNALSGGTAAGVVIHNVAVTNPDEELEILLRAPLSIMNAPAQNAVIVIDALDEALSYKGTPNLVELFAKLQGLPPWMTLFCTSRRSDAVLSHLQPLRPFVLEAGSDGNLADVRAYVEKRAADQSISNQLQQSGTSKETFIDRITNRAAGNFLYATIVLDDVSAGRLRADKFEELPLGLDVIYANFLRRIPDGDQHSIFKSILGKLAVAQEPLTEEHLVAFTGMVPTKLRSALGILDQYLNQSEAEGTVYFELFHESLRDFLLAKNRAGRYWCNPDEEHGAISDYCLGDLNAHGVSGDPYVIRHLPLHLSEAGKCEDLIKLLSDYLWLKTKLDNTTVYDLLADFRLAPRQTPIEDIESIIRLSTFALERDAEQFWSQLYSRSLQRTDPLLRNFPLKPKAAWLRPQLPTMRQFEHPLKWVLYGHTQLVKHVCAVPNSSLVVSCSFDRSICIWDLDSGREVRRIRGHTNDVNSVALSPDGSRIVTGSDDKTVRIWDFHSGRETGRIDQLPSTPEPVVLSQDGRYMAAVIDGDPSYHDDIWIWESAGQTLVRKIRTKRGIHNITFIPQTTWIAGRGRGADVIIWDIQTGKEVRRYRHKGSDGFPNPAIAASFDGKFLASGGVEEDAIIKVFRLEDDKFFVLPTKSRGAMRCLAFSPDGKRLLAVARPGQTLPDNNVLDDSVELWDLASRKCLARYPHDGFVQAITFSSDGALGICATGNGKISVWHLGKKLPETEKHSAHVIKASVRHPTDQASRAFTASIDGSVFVWNLDTLKIERILRSSLPLRAMDVNSDGSRVLTSGFEETWIEGGDVFFRELLMHEVNSNSKPTRLFSKIGEDAHYSTILLLAEHAFLARWDRNDIGDSFGFVELWDLEHRQCLVCVDNQKDYIHAAIPLERGRKIMTVSRRLCVWTLNDLKAGPLVVAEREYPMGVIAPSHDGSLGAIGGGGMIEVWDLKALRQVTSFSTHPAGIHDVCFVGDADLIASAGSDHSVRVWDWKGSAQRLSFYGDSAITAVAWADSWQTLVAGEESGRVHFLRLEKDCPGEESCSECFHRQVSKNPLLAWLAKVLK